MKIIFSEKNCKKHGDDPYKILKEPLSDHAMLYDVAISEVDFLYLITQLDAIAILLKEDNFKMYSRSNLERMVLSLKNELKKYVSNII